MTQFDSLGLAEPLLRALDERGYSQATPIQARAIPAVLAGRDVLAAAQTGTGKTAGFTLPLLQRLSATPSKGKVRALILTPTRELAAQIGENVTAYSRYLPLRSTVVFGGVGINPQIDRLRAGIDVLVATPGRLLDLQGQRALDLSGIEILVLDEADRMLDMGFIHDIRRVLKLLPAQRQNLLFSATFSDEIRRLTEGLLQDPVTIDVAPRNTAAESVEQTVFRVEKSDKPALLSHLIHSGGWEQVLVFTRTKHGANRLVQKLERTGITAAAIHGNKSQNARTAALAAFKQGGIRALVATDIAARGLDIAQLPQVVNFELPNVAEDYVHRIGRTGRAGASGAAVSLVSGDEAGLLRQIERLLRRSLEVSALPAFERSSEPADADDERPPRPPRRQGGGQPGAGRSQQPRGQAAGREPSRAAGGRGQGGPRGAAPGNGNSNGNQAEPERSRRRRGGRSRQGGGGQGSGQAAAVPRGRVF